MKTETVTDKQIRQRSLESEINRELGFLEGIGLALPEKVQGSYFDTLEVLSKNISDLFEPW